jgi:plastocyanin
MRTPLFVFLPSIALLSLLPSSSVDRGASPELGAPPTAHQESGAIRGKCLFLGEAPKRREVDMGSDPKCHQLHADGIREDWAIVGEHGELANVFVWVSKGFEGRKFEPPKEPAVLEQKGCVYTPHVFGVQVGQRLVIKNGDPVTHNVHSFAKKNEAFNQSQPSGGKDIERVFDHEEVFVQAKCDLHGWMSSYVGVVEHPYFAVAREDGTFEIAGLPPGEYTISAKHEAFGLQKAKVKVDAGGVSQAELAFEE